VGLVLLIAVPLVVLLLAGGGSGSGAIGSAPQRGPSML